MNRVARIAATALAISSVLMLSGSVVPCEASVRYVKWDANGANNGTSWANAYTDLQAALTAAASGDQLWLAAGTYRPGSPTAPRTATFRLKNGVGIYGGFNGTETDLSQRDPVAHETVLSGDLQGDDAPDFQGNSENSYNVVTGSGTNSTAVLDGVTITGGNANGSGLPTNGGGGLAIITGNPSITSCKIIANYGSLYGGGVYIAGGNPTINYCIFIDNWCGRYGGGVYTRQSDSVFTDCTFIGNRSEVYGGGMWNQNGSPTFTNCTIRNNHAEYGGGVSNFENGNPILLNCICSLNSAFGGGGIYNSGSSPELVNCLIHANSASNLGGAMRNDDFKPIGEPVIVSQPQLVNCTIVDNIANSGFGLYNMDNSHAVVYNCVLWGNRKTDGSAFLPQIVDEPAGPTSQVSYSCVQGGAIGEGNLADDPLFVDPLGPDGIARTIDDNYRIRSGSPCVDAGDNTAVPLDVATELDGKTRFLDDPTMTDHGKGGKPPVDIGAYELWEFEVPRNVRVVRAGAAAGGDGKTWDSAWNSLAAALVESADPPPGEPDITEVWVAAGRYTPGPPGVRTSTFRLRNQLKLIGGFHQELSPFAPKPFLHETVLSGDLKGDDNGLVDNKTVDNAFHVVTGSGTNASALLYGFTIEGGNANSTPYPHDCGGGMLNHQGSPTVVNCLFRRNTAIDGGAMFNLIGNPQVTNCRFIGNRALNSGGGMHNETASLPLVANCAFISNSATGFGGALTALDAYNIYADPDLPTIVNSIFWGNQARVGPEFCIQEGRFSISVLAVGGCNVRNGTDSVAVGPNCQLFWDAGLPNRDVQPLVTPDAHLWFTSPLADADNSGLLPPDTADLDRDSDVMEAVPVDCDGADRIVNSKLDIGADEYADADQDGLPDDWEQRFFLSVTAAGPDEDSDGDGLSNLDEYQVYGSHPQSSPIFVDGGNGNDLWSGLSPTAEPDGSGPKKTIQAAINAAESGNTVVVLPGIYSGAGNVNLSFAGKAIVLRAQTQPAETVLDCGNVARAVDYATLPETGAAILGFTVTRGNADRGGALRINGTRLLVKDCILYNNSASVDAGSLWGELGTLVVSNLVLAAAGGTDSTGVLASCAIDLENDFGISSGRLDLRSSRIDGPGTILLGSAGTLRISKDSAIPLATAVSPTICRSDISGTGSIEIDPGQRLIVAGNASVDLSDGANGRGRITVEGSLVARDNATVRNTEIIVRQAAVKDGSVIQYNNIRLLDAINSGGEFFVQDQAHIKGNTIHSVGDRYLDLDPDPDPLAGHPDIDSNTIHVEIETNPAIQQGTLLELRARDYECSPTGSNPSCLPGIRQAAIPADCLDDPADNWILETLEIKPGSRLNLTNRPGFDYQPDTDTPDTVYVRHLILRENAVLNTAFQTLYYENLTMENGASVVEEPLLGFSLGIIKMNDQEAKSGFNEFDLRIHRRTTDAADPNPPLPIEPIYAGSIRKLDKVTGQPDMTAADGVMEMRTQASGRQPASSVAAKGSFARAGQEDVTILFEYLWQNAGPGNDAELTISISANPDVSEELVEVARIRPAGSGPGAIGQWGTFYAKFPKGLLKFIRGTYVELTLRGAGAVIWIENWDPQIECSNVCGDLGGNGATTFKDDYLQLIAEFGQYLPETTTKWCLERMIGGSDMIVDLNDILAWEAILSNSEGLNYCPDVGATSSRNRSGMSQSGPTLPDRLLIAGKPGGDYVQDDRMYVLDPAGISLAGGQTAISPTAYLYNIEPTRSSCPVGWDCNRGGGRVIADATGTLYQLHGTLGLIRLEDGKPIVKPDRHILSDDEIYVGLKENAATGQYDGYPLADAAFDPVDPNVVYVVPVMIKPSAALNRCPYPGAARLRLTDREQGVYSVEKKYGVNPEQEPLVVGGLSYCLPIVSSGEYYSAPREIEVDDTGRLWLLSVHGLNENDWLMAYEAASGERVVNPIRLLDELPPGQPAADFKGASSMLWLPGNPGRLYMTASVNWDNGLTSRIYEFSVGASVSFTRVIEVNHPVPDNCLPPNSPCDLYLSGITSMQARNGRVYVVGFSSPRYPENSFLDASITSLFTTATLATFEPGEAGPLTSAKIGAGDLRMPISIVFGSVPNSQASPGDFDFDGDVDTADYALFRACWSGANVPPASGCADKDLDRDNDVDQADLAVFQQNITELGDAPMLVSALSRRSHGQAGDFDISLPLSPSATGIECRAGSPTKILLTLSKPVVAADNAFNVTEVSLSAGTLGAVTADGNQITVNLSAVPDMVCLSLNLGATVTDLTGRSLTGTRSLSVRVLLGDTNATGSVSVADVNQTRSRSGQTADAITFRSDTNCSGSISVADVNQVRSRSGNFITCP